VRVFQVRLGVVDHRLLRPDGLVRAFSEASEALESASADAQRRRCPVKSASGCIFSSRASNWPFRTRSPSFTRI